MKRRTFNRAILLSAASVGLPILGCKEKPVDSFSQATEITQRFKWSLAQWSLHRSIKEEGMDPFSFASVAKGLGFEGIEYVNHLYNDFLKDQDDLQGVKALAKKLKQNANNAQIESVLIMVDGEGDLGTQDYAARLVGVENHYKWVDAASALGCHCIRLNLFGDGSRDAQADTAADSMRRIAEYAKDMNVNILVENHGGYSSDPSWLVLVMQNVNMDNVGILPDFGNFCIEREEGKRWGGACVNEYPDKYEAVKTMLPYAKAISAKSYEFDENGNETTIDYHKMMSIIKVSDYQGYIGVEFEGPGDEKEGILKTKNLLTKALAT